MVTGLNIVAMLQKQQTVFNKILEKQGAFEERQNKLEEKLNDVENQLPHSTTPSSSDSSKRKRVVTHTLLVNFSHKHKSKVVMPHLHCMVK